MAVEVITSHEQICDSNGVPVSGALVYIYDVGTTTPKTVYSDPGLDPGDAASNPITCDSSGRHDVRYIATGSYKYVVKTAAGASIYTRDEVDGRIPVGSGALAIANGGTSATTASGALAALGAATAAEVADLAADVASLAGAAASTEKTQLAVGTTAQRPASPAVGQVRWNSTTSELEAYDGSSWYNIITNESRATTAEVTSETTGKFIDADRAKYHQGIAKAWAYVTNTAGTTTLVDSYNVTSVTDNGAGDTTVNLSITMANANFAAVASSIATNVESAVVTAKTTTTVRVVTVNDTGSASDAGFSVVIFGDI